MGSGKILANTRVLYALCIARTGEQRRKWLEPGSSCSIYENDIDDDPYSKSIKYFSSMLDFSLNDPVQYFNYLVIPRARPRS